MIDHLEMARQFVQEQLEHRSDIIGAMVFGSVARGEAGETSDIDLSILTKTGDAQFNRDLATWRRGVYIEAGLRSIEALSDFEKVMKHPVHATHINDALILHDPTGYLADLQSRVRAVYMEPKWLKLRLEPNLIKGRRGLALLRDAIGADKPEQVCFGMSDLIACYRSVPLLRIGITPSSARPLTQLAEAFPDLLKRILELEGSLGMQPEEALNRVVFFSRIGRLLDQERFGGLMEYLEKKLPIMAKDGRHPDVIAGIWFTWAFAPKPDESTAEIAEEVSTLASDWLAAVGWEAIGDYTGKVERAGSILQDVEAMAADLPEG